MVLDEAKRKVWVRGKEIELTPKEFDLLELLWHNPGKVFIRRIREKIEEDPGTPTLLLTKWGVGYYLREQKNV